MYLLVPLGRGDRGDDSCYGCVRNGGPWWPEEAFKGDGDYVAAAATLIVASLESVVRLLMCRGSSRW